jgi:hypothetical protein
MTPKVKVFLDFIDTYLGTDLDPRLQGAKARLAEGRLLSSAVFFV